MLILMISQNGLARSIPYPVDDLKINARLSQSKVVQHGANTIYVDMSFMPPAVNRFDRVQQRATDIIIVLDRSGSMSEAKKMPYAKAAILDVLGRLNNNDRFALVSFANNAIVQSPLVNVTSANRQYLNNVVTSIKASGGTNMSSGLETAISLLQNNQMDRSRKILLLSDGQANQGITDPQQLSQIASRATQFGVVLSTIGMGLGFNETLMAQLADYGMGHYSYLEDLSGLGTILARDLKDTRNIYATGSTLQIKLGDGVRLLDAGGYPMNQLDGSTVNIVTGQMLSNTQKHFVMTFTVPNQQVGQFSLADMNLQYQVDGQQKNRRVNQSLLHLAVVPPHLHHQAKQSIDREVYQKSWMKNNFGIMQKKLSKLMREGKKEKAKKEIAAYRLEMDAAAASSDIELATPELKNKLDDMEGQIDQVFSGSLMDQQVKRNRAAKSMQFDSIKTQRK